MLRLFSFIFLASCFEIKRTRGVVLWIGGDPMNNLNFFKFDNYNIHIYINYYEIYWWKIFYWKTTKVMKDKISVDQVDGYLEPFCGALSVLIHMNDTFKCRI